MAKFDLSSVYSSENTYSVLKLLKKLIDKIDNTEFASPDDVQAVKDYVDAELANYVTQQGLSLVLEDYTTLATLNSRLSGYYPKVDGLEIRSDIELITDPGEYSVGIKVTKYPFVIDCGDWQYCFSDDGYIAKSHSNITYDLLSDEILNNGFSMHKVITFFDVNDERIYSVGCNENINDDDFCVITPRIANKTYILFTNYIDDTSIFEFYVNNNKSVTKIGFLDLTIDYVISGNFPSIIGNGTLMLENGYSEDTSIALSDDAIQIYSAAEFNIITDNIHFWNSSEDYSFYVHTDTGLITYGDGSSLGNITLNNFVINLTLSGDNTPTLLSTAGTLSIADSVGENAEITLNSQGVIGFSGISYEFNGETLSITDGVNSHGWHFDTTTWEFWYTDGYGVDHEYATQDWVNSAIASAQLGVNLYKHKLEISYYIMQGVNRTHEVKLIINVITTSSTQITSVSDAVSYATNKIVGVGGYVHNNGTSFNSNIYDAFIGHAGGGAPTISASALNDSGSESTYAVNSQYTTSFTDTVTQLN